MSSPIQSLRTHALSRVLAISCGIFAIGACGDKKAKPDEAMRAFLRAAGTGDRAQVYGMLTPKAQAAMKKLADLATAQAGGRRRFKPHELLGHSLAKTRHRLKTVDLVKVEGDHAQVKLVESRDGHSEVWNLQRIDGKWRVLLPAGILANGVR